MLDDGRIRLFPIAALPASGSAANRTVRVFNAGEERVREKVSRRLQRRKWRDRNRRYAKTPGSALPPIAALPASGSAAKRTVRVFNARDERAREKVSRHFQKAQVARSEQAIRENAWIGLAPPSRHFPLPEVPRTSPFASSTPVMNAPERRFRATSKKRKWRDRMKARSGCRAMTNSFPHRGTSRFWKCRETHRSRLQRR